MADAARSSRWSDLRRRVISASLLAPVVLLCLWVGSVPFAVLLLLGAVGLAVEWVGLCRLSPTRWPGALLPLLVVAGALCAAFGQVGAAVLIVLVGAAALAVATRRTLMAAGLPFVALAPIALLWMRGEPSLDGRRLVFFVVLVVWASDIGAYATGRLVGGPKLAPALSPAKTWSGSIGGLALAIVVGLFVAGHVSAPVAAFAALLAVVCQAGDLLESGIKRHVGVKDSGRLIPGHGGLLDRLDGLLAAAPVAAIAVLLGREGIF